MKLRNLNGNTALLALSFAAIILCVAQCGSSQKESATADNPEEMITADTSVANTPPHTDGASEDLTMPSNTDDPAPMAALPSFDAAKYEGPTFELESMTGGALSFTQFLGKGPLVLNFWGTWCPPCRAEIPEFVEIYSKYRPQGVEIVGVSIRDTKEKLQSFTSQNGMSWPQVLGTPITLGDFGNINGVPTTIIYDRTGIEIFRHVGPLSAAQFASELDKLLAAQIPG